MSLLNDVFGHVLQSGTADALHAHGGGQLAYGGGGRQKMAGGRPQGFFSYNPSSPSSSSSSPTLPSLRYSEMSPETTLIEFISTSAAFHGVKKCNLKQLEWDLFKVFPNNIMPTNAAAWYMGKRRFYPGNELLPVLLKNYPKKFAVKGATVEFLETYNKDVAKRKLNAMIQQGTVAYFTHKMEEHGVYFFDPFYYENTEPFHANLRQVTNSFRSHRVKLIPQFFEMHKDAFVFQKISPYLVTISKEPVEVKVNVTCVVVSMVDNQFGVLQFNGDGGSTEKAFFSSKSLYRDGNQYTGDPMRLPHMEFDGYRLPLGKGDKEYTWYAVLVWSGRKPNPKFCSTKEDLTSSPYFQNQAAPSHEDIVAKAIRGSGEPVIRDCMQVGEVLDIRRDGAVVSRGKDSDERAFIPGWQHRNNKARGAAFLVTTQGVELAMKDLIAFYIDPKGEANKEFKAIGCNVMVLKHADAPSKSASSESGDDAAKKKRKSRDRKLSSKSGVSGLVTEDESDGAGHSRRKEKAAKEGRAKKKSESAPPLPHYKLDVLEYLFHGEVDDSDVYDSDVDPSYMPSSFPEPEYDYDEYSDGEIYDEEKDELMKEAKAELDVDALRKKIKEAEEEEAEGGKKATPEKKEDGQAEKKEDAKAEGKEEKVAKPVSESEIIKLKNLISDAGDSAPETKKVVGSAGDIAKKTGGSAKTANDSSKKAGDSADMAGDYAKIAGDIAKMAGDSAAKTGDSAKLAGDSAKITGDSAKMAGDSAKMAGDSAKMAGDSAKKAGDSAAKSGDSAKKAGDSEAKKADAIVAAKEKA